MISSYAVVNVLGAGLPPTALDEIKGELDSYRRAPHRSGAPVADPELVPIAVTSTLAARFQDRNWHHLPTLTSLGCLHTAVGCATLAILSFLAPTPLVGSASSYVPLVVVLGTLSVLFARTGTVPVHTFATASVVLAAAIAAQVVGGVRLGVTDWMTHLALGGCAIVLPLAWVPLAWMLRRRPLPWNDLPVLVARRATTRTAWRALAGFALLAALGNLAMLATATTGLPPAAKVAYATNMWGLFLLWRAFTWVCRPTVAVH